MGWAGLTNRFLNTEATRVATTSGRSTVPPERKSVIGQRALNKYEILQLIGEGSNGEVFLARDHNTVDSYVVVKRVKQQLLNNPRFQQFFLSEVQSMQRFCHPYVVQLLDASINDPIGPCLVLEYIHGVTLESILQRHPRWYPERLARLLGQLCHALQAAHDAGIVHRDLKPANLMVANFNTPEETLKVMDFGFAGFTERPHVQIAELTGHGPIFACGTPAYVSPEMIRGDSVDGRADLYAVGVILYEMIAGRLPFEYPQVEEILAAHVKCSPPRLAKIGVTDVSAKVEGFLNVALSKYPNERHQTAKELAQQFGTAIGMNIWEDTRPPGWEDGQSSSRTSEVIVDCTLIEAANNSKEDEFILSDKFEANLAPKLAAIKLRGFVEEVGGTVLDSEPGLIRMRVALPKGYQDPKSRSAMLGWLAAIRQPSVRTGQEPINVTLKMRNINPNRVEVKVSFRPMPEYLPKDKQVWTERCEQLYNVLRMYLMASP